MPAQLDHLLVPARDRLASARLLAQLLGVPWAEFDAILARIVAAGLPHRSTPHGPADGKVNEEHGGRIVYWSEPDGHVWELLTVSYARKA